jgi:hypothetical protein
MLTKEQIVADATVRFTELNKTLLDADLPPFPIETAYMDLYDELNNGDDAVVTKWFNECMLKTEELGASIPTGSGFHPLMLQFKLQLKFIETVCEIHSKLIMMLIIAARAEVTLH